MERLDQSQRFPFPFPLLQLSSNARVTIIAGESCLRPRTGSEAERTIYESDNGSLQQGRGGKTEPLGDCRL